MHNRRAQVGKLLQKQNGNFKGENTGSGIAVGEPILQRVAMRYLYRIFLNNNSMVNSNRGGD
jgi:hypothetical protein